MKLSDFTEHCLANKENIYVREQLNGKWGSYSLAELSHDTMYEWILRWYEENRMPVILNEE